MKPEAQRIAIAEACGWSAIDDVSWIARVPESDLGGNRHREIPNYLNDLNAMHEAEKMLTGDQCKLYFRTLFDVVGNSLSPMNMVHATAVQRAEAFLRTRGKWETDASNLSTVESNTAQHLT